MPPKSESMRRGRYKLRALEMNLQLREQQLKTISHIYMDSDQNFRITANQKSTIDTQTNKIKQIKYITRLVIQPQEERTREGKKKEQQKQIQSN